jgi:hypothetical protein
MGAGLQRVLKSVGSMIVQGEDGKNVVWMWDYVNDKARLKSEMTKEELNASEKAKWEGIKKTINENKHNNENNNF